MFSIICRFFGVLIEFFLQLLIFKTLEQGQADATLSCSGGFSYPDNDGEMKSYDYIGLNGMAGIEHNECCCQPYSWRGWIRHIDPNFNTHANPETIEHNNDYSKKWCEEMLDKYGGLGGNEGVFSCSGPCTQDEPQTTTSPAVTTDPPVTTDNPVTANPDGSKDYINVCYFTNWAQYRTGYAAFLPSNIDPHLVSSFGIRVKT